MEALRELSWSGIPPHLRSLCWRLLLGYLPPSRDRRQQILARKRQEYRWGAQVHSRCEICVWRMDDTQACDHNLDHHAQQPACRACGAMECVLFHIVAYELACRLDALRRPVASQHHPAPVFLFVVGIWCLITTTLPAALGHQKRNWGPCGRYFLIIATHRLI